MDAFRTKYNFTQLTILNEDVLTTTVQSLADYHILISWISQTQANMRTVALKLGFLSLFTTAFQTVFLTKPMYDLIRRGSLEDIQIDLEFCCKMKYKSKNAGDLVYLKHLYCCVNTGITINNFVRNTICFIVYCIILFNLDAEEPLYLDAIRIELQHVVDVTFSCSKTNADYRSMRGHNNLIDYSKKINFNFLGSHVCFVVSDFLSQCINEFSMEKINNSSANITDETVVGEVGYTDAENVFHAAIVQFEISNYLINRARSVFDSLCSGQSDDLVDSISGYIFQTTLDYFKSEDSMDETDELLNECQEQNIKDQLDTYIKSDRPEVSLINNSRQNCRVTTRKSSDETSSTDSDPDISSDGSHNQNSSDDDSEYSDENVRT
jgi:hypothetical protein